MKKFLMLSLILGIFGFSTISAKEVKDGDKLVSIFYSSYNYQYEIAADTGDQSFVMIAPGIGIITHDGWVIIRSVEELCEEELYALIDTDFDAEVLDSPKVLWHIE